MGSKDAQKGRMWAARLARHRAGGLTVSRFCKQEGVSVNTYYYWAKRLRAAPAPSRAGEASLPKGRSATPTTASDSAESMVCFSWNAGVEVWVPAGCLETIRCLTECLARADGERCGAFREVVVKA